MVRRVDDAVFDSDRVAKSILPTNLHSRYSAASYRGAAQLLSQRATGELGAVLRVLEKFWITETEIRSPGGSETVFTQRFREFAKQEGFAHEVHIQADLIVKLLQGRGKNPVEIDRILREDYVHNHFVDFWMGRIAFDYEWNSKDQTYDRDLYAIRSFFEIGIIDAGIIVTRDLDNEFFKSLGKALDKHGNETDRDVSAKFGASTTGMAKLITRIAAGRSGGCPVLAVGILPGNIIP